MKTRLAKWMIRAGASLLGRGYIVTLRGDIVIPNGSFGISWDGTSGGGGGGANGAGGISGGGGSGSTRLNLIQDSSGGGGPFCGANGRQCFRPDHSCLVAGHCLGISKSDAAAGDDTGTPRP